MKNKEIMATETLDTLIPMYAENKSTYESYKKLCDDQNTQIKTLMREQDTLEYETENHIAKLSISERTTLNEDKVLSTLKTLGIDKFIKTKEYVDMEMLESAMFSGEISADTFKDCITVKEVVSLRVGGKK